MGLGIVLEHGIHPINVVDIAIRIADRGHGSPIVGNTSGIDVLLIHDGHVFGCIEHLGLASHILPANICIKADNSLAFTSVLGGDKHYTVARLVAVDGSRCRVLEHVNALNVTGVERRNITAHTIDDEERP